MMEDLGGSRQRDGAVGGGKGQDTQVLAIGNQQIGLDYKIRSQNNGI